MTALGIAATLLIRFGALSRLARKRALEGEGELRRQISRLDQTGVDPITDAIGFAAKSLARGQAKAEQPSQPVRDAMDHHKPGDAASQEKGRRNEGGPERA